MDNDNARKSKRKLKKREENVKVAERNDNTDVTSQENVFKDRKPKKKRKTLDDTSNIVTVNNDTAKKDLPENKKLSKRQLKKNKAMKAKIEMLEHRKVIAKERAHDYINKWKYCKNEWKFEKLKQIWLIDHLMYIDCISEELFPIVLEYFKECKGMARKTLIEKAMEVIRKAELEENEEHKTAIINSIEYNRARQLLQILPSTDEC